MTLSADLLITTPGQVLRFNLGTRRLSVVDEGRIEYYGSSWPETGSPLVLGHSVYENYRDFDDLVQSEVGYVSIGQRTSDPGLSFPHQILCQGDRILITNTGRNALAQMRLDDLSMRQRRYDDAMWDSLGGANHPGGHFNSLFQRGDTLYLLAHNNGRPSYVHELDAETLDLKATVRSKHFTGLHNIWVTPDGQYLACHSLSGAIIDIKTDRVVFASHSTSFTRGLASDGRYLFVGNSTGGARETRRHSESGLWIIDLETWTDVEYVNLGNFGNVKDVRLVNEPDLCHHGHVLKEEAIPFVRDIDLPSGDRVMRQAEHRLDLGEWRPILGCIHKDAEDRLQSFPGQLSVASRVDTDAADVRVLATVHLEEAVGHDSLLARLRGIEASGEAYAAMVYGPEPTATLWKVADGQWTELASTVAPDLPWPLRMVFEVVGNRLTLTLNGAPSLEVVDDAVTGAGAVGIRILDHGLKVEAFQVDRL